jgi:hypothetical protein
MPHLTRLVFMKCADLKPERLQEVVDNRLSSFIEVCVCVCVLWSLLVCLVPLPDHGATHCSANDGAGVMFY